MQVKHGRWCLILVMALVLASITLPVSAEETQAPVEEVKAPVEETQAPAEETQTPDDKIAVVNGSAIPRAEFDRQLEGAQRRIMMMRGARGGSDVSDLKKKTLDGLIERELLYQASQEKGIVVDEVEINKRLGTMKTRFPGQAEFDNALSQMALTEEMVKDQLRQGLAVEGLVEEQIVKNVTISDEEIKAYYDDNPDSFKKPEQVQASHILIKFPPEADDAQKAEVRKEIEQIQEKLQNGEDFAALAKEFSKCPSSAKGGDLGSFGRGQMVKPFEDAAFTLEPGKTSDVVETRFGYHLIKVADRQPESTVPFEEVKEGLIRFLKQTKIQEGISEYVGELRKTAKIETFLEEPSE